MIGSGHCDLCRSDAIYACHEPDLFSVTETWIKIAIEGKLLQVFDVLQWIER